MSLSGPGQTYIFSASDNAWDGVGRTRPVQVVGFPTFTDLDVFNGVAIPTGSLDSGTQNVGCRIPRAQLTTVAGDHVGANGVTYRGLLIQGQVTTAASTDQAFYVDCVILGKNRPTSKQAMAVGHNYDFGGTTFTYCTFDATGRESMWQDCINGGNWTLNYCELMRGVDGLGGNTVGNGVAYCCRVYHGFYQSWWDDVAGAPRTASYTDFGGTTYNPPFPTQSTGDVHGDGGQFQGYTGWSVKGCYIGGSHYVTSPTSHLDPTVSADYTIIQGISADASYPNSGVILNALSAHPLGALIEHNVFQGGAARVSISTNGADTASGVIVRNNLFVRDSYGYQINAQTGHAATLSNNLYTDDRTAVPVHLF